MTTLSDAPARCDACGHPPSHGDPLTYVADSGTWVHESHIADLRSGYYNGTIAPARPSDCCAAHQAVDPAALAAIHLGNVAGARSVPVCVVCLERLLEQCRRMAREALGSPRGLDGAS